MQGTESFDNGTAYIVGYIHVCQKEHWERSFDLLMTSLHFSGLYNRCHEIRIGVVNDTATLVEDERLKDPKFTIVLIEKSQAYERPTLLHMKHMSDMDPEDTVYFYLHTKGLRHFGTQREDKVLKWIKNMLYWNVEQWEKAVQCLKTHEAYGINYTGNHYSGNFWWATRDHIRRLPDTIPAYYTAPEDWVCMDKTGLYCAHNGGADFDSSYMSGIYTSNEGEKGLKDNASSLAFFLPTTGYRWGRKQRYS